MALHSLPFLFSPLCLFRAGSELPLYCVSCLCSVEGEKQTSRSWAGPLPQAVPSLHPTLPPGPSSPRVVLCISWVKQNEKGKGVLILETLLRGAAARKSQHKYFHAHAAQFLHVFPGMKQRSFKEAGACQLPVVTAEVRSCLLCRPGEGWKPQLILGRNTSTNHVWLQRITRST